MSAAAPELPAVPEPFPIFTLAQRYLIYDANTVSHVRCSHNISGVFIGGLAQAPQQNVFLGLPLELLPEEARLLVEKGVAYIVDDVRQHKAMFLEDGLGVEERRAYRAALRKQGLGAAGEHTKRTERRKKEALREKAGTEVWNDVPDDMLAKPIAGRTKDGEDVVDGEKAGATADDTEESLFDTTTTTTRSSSTPTTIHKQQPPSLTSAHLEPYAVTPTTSHPPLQSLPPAHESDHAAALPAVPPSYPIFKHLHNRGYFLAPGLRFGCQYVAYPGDPLRFHSHFLVNGLDWDEEFDLIDLVAGGRLGTGVKKGFLLGGLEDADAEAEQVSNGSGGGGDKGLAESGVETRDGVRAFCVEWGGM